MRYFLLYICLLFSASDTLLAQGSNPFDLKNRAKAEINTSAPQTDKKPDSNPFDLNPGKKVDTLASDKAKTVNNAPTIAITPEDQTNTTQPKQSNNPFDLQRGSKTKVENSTGNTTTENLDEDSPTTSDEAKSFTNTNQSTGKSSPETVIRKKAGKQEGQQQTFLFWTILGLLFVGTLVFVLFQPFLRKSYRAFTNDNMLKLLQRENSGSITFPYIVLYTFFFINAGVFTYLASTHFGLVRENFGSFLFKCILGIAAFFLVKHLLLSFISTIFQINKEIEQYNFTIVVFSIILGIALVPFNVLTAFSTETVSQMAFYGAFLVIMIFYLFRFFRSLFIASRFAALNKFHFFMYLCTIEIAPIAILIKVLMNQSGI